MEEVRLCRLTGEALADQLHAVGGMGDDEVRPVCCQPGEQFLQPTAARVMGMLVVQHPHHLPAPQLQPHEPQHGNERLDVSVAEVGDTLEPVEDDDVALPSRLQEREERIAMGRIDDFHAGQRGECLHHVVDVGVGACARTGLQVGEDGDFHRREAVQW